MKYKSTKKEKKKEVKNKVLKTKYEYYLKAFLILINTCMKANNNRFFFLLVYK